LNRKKGLFLELDKIICGDALKIMKQWPARFIDCVVTSPPYWGLRDYGIEGQLGLEKTPEEYIEKMVVIFREVRHVLKKTGTCWINMGDSYATTANGQLVEDKKLTSSDDRTFRNKPFSTTVSGLKPKDLCMMPHRLAMALQADGWWVRSDIVWNKPNPMPESVTDRPTKAHEYIFLCSKSAKYYFDADAIREEHKEPERGKGEKEKNNWSVDCKRGSHETVRLYNPAGRNKRSVWTVDGVPCIGELLIQKVNAFTDAHPEIDYGWFTDLLADIVNAQSNKKDVWDIATAPYPEAHFATFPPKLIEPCILAGCPEWVCKKCGKARERITEKEKLPISFREWSKKNNPRGDGMKLVGGGTMQKYYDTFSDGNPPTPKTTGWTDRTCKAGLDGGIVLDPFMGSGTTAVVAYENRRHYIGVELNQEYIDLGRIEKVKEQYALIE
jgi:DNA modification methylase